MDHSTESRGRPVDEAELAALSALIDADDAVDLHSHSRHSDGHWTPSELIDEARRLGLKLISLTDHDTVGGQEAALAAARRDGLVFLTGMEVSLTVDGRPYHVLAYDFDWASPTWGRFVERRRRRFEVFYLDLFEQLRSRGYEVNPDLARGEDGWFVENPLAVALHRSGQAPSLEVADQRIRGLGLRRTIELTYQDAAAFGEILRPGEAVFSVAHPGRQETGVSVRLSEDDLRRLQEAVSLVALEVQHPYHSASDVEHYHRLAERYGLAVTCGSDAHGHQVRRPLRKHSASVCRQFLQIIRERWAARIRVLAVPG